MRHGAAGRGGARRGADLGVDALALAQRLDDGADRLRGRRKRHIDRLLDSVRAASAACWRATPRCGSLTHTCAHVCDTHVCTHMCDTHAHTPLHTTRHVRTMTKRSRFFTSASSGSGSGSGESGPSVSCESCRSSTAGGARSSMRRISSLTERVRVPPDLRARRRRRRAAESSLSDEERSPRRSCRPSEPAELSK
jgi:hypothetical protein